jgi:mannobiose 2-epimerase
MQRARLRHVSSALASSGALALSGALVLSGVLACSSPRGEVSPPAPVENVGTDPASHEPNAGANDEPAPAESGADDLGGEITPGELLQPLVGDAGSPPVGAANTDAGAVDAGLPNADAGEPPPLDPIIVARAARLLDFSERLAPLARRSMDFWLEHGPDASFGGFHGTLDRQGNPSTPDDKGLVQEARHLWTLSTWYERREPSARIAALADSTYAFIRRSFVDAADGAFVFKVSRDGRRVVDAKKQLFAESYAIYAIATYGRVFGVPEALDLALARFVGIDTLRHDATFGGYDQSGDPGTLSAGAERDSNTHLHLLEAFTALYEATGDVRVGARLNELVDLFASTLRQSSGYVAQELSRRWVPFGTPSVGYGFDLETSWLMLEAARVLGREGDETLRSAALSIAAHSATRGVDAALGGYFELGVPQAAVTDRDKIWWVQFEALNGLWWAFDVSRDDVYLERLSSTLGWIEATEDRPIGEWFATTNPDGSPQGGADYKGDEWKESYHPVRALVYVQDWVDAARAALLAR